MVARRERVVVVPYDDQWPGRFGDLEARIWPAVADLALGVEHVGSTSVPFLAAKPIIDMTIVVADRSSVPPIIDRLATIGYRHQGNLGIQDREAFEHPPELPRHNLYVCPQGTIGIVNQIAVRDYLRAHSDAARQYAALKMALAARHPDDIDSYVLGKTGFILDILKRAGVSDAELAQIERDNRPGA